MKNNKKLNSLMELFAGGKALALASVISIIFGIAGVVAAIIALSGGASAQYTAALVIELIFCVFSCIIGGALLAELNKPQAFKIAFVLFVINGFLVYFASDNFIIAVVYIFNAALIALDMIKNYQKPAEVEDKKEDNNSQDTIETEEVEKENAEISDEDIKKEVQ